MQNQVIEKKHLTTAEFAGLIGRQGGTLRHSLCTKGHYLGIRPVKLPTGHLLWPKDKVDALLKGAGQ